MHTNTIPKPEEENKEEQLYLLCSSSVHPLPVSPKTHSHAHHLLLGSLSEMPSNGLCFQVPSRN